MKTKSLIALAAVASMLAAPAYAQWEDGVAAAVGAGWWGQDLASSPGLSGGPNIMDDLEDNESLRLSDGHWELTHSMADLDGDGNVSRSELMGMLEGGNLRNPAAAPTGLTDVSVADVTSDSTGAAPTGLTDVSVADVTGGESASTSGLIDVSVADVDGEGAARMADSVDPSSDDPQGYEAVTLEQGVDGFSAEIGRRPGPALISNPLSILSERVEARFVHADQNQDDKVDLQEMMQLRREFMQARGNEDAGNDTKVRKQANRIIGRIDTDGDQMISREELAAARGNRVMQRLDTDGDGQISPAEWEVTLN